MPLLNDRLLRRLWLSGPSSGRIAQLVEQLTLNQRVVGSSPTAPTKAFQELTLILPPPPHTGARLRSRWAQPIRITVSTMVNVETAAMVGSI